MVPLCRRRAECHPSKAMLLSRGDIPLHGGHHFYNVTPRAMFSRDDVLIYCPPFFTSRAITSLNTCLLPSTKMLSRFWRMPSYQRIWLSTSSKWIRINRNILRPNCWGQGIQYTGSISVIAMYGERSFDLCHIGRRVTLHERTTTAKNMGILKYHQTSLISYERGWHLACLDGRIKSNQASHQGARCFYAKRYLSCL
jgi:hypothetical protein